MKEVDEGILLHKRTYSESSLITTIFTRKNGVRSFIYKGAKKKNNLLFPLALNEITFYGRKDSDLLHLTETNPLLALTFQFDPIRSSVVFFVSELLYLCLRTEQEDEELFIFLIDSIKELNGENFLPTFPISFAMELTKHLGFSPLIEDDCSFFNLTLGVFQKTPGIENHEVVSGNIAEYFKAIISGKESLELSKQERLLALNAVQNYYLIHVTGFKKMKSLPVLQTILND